MGLLDRLLGRRSTPRWNDAPPLASSPAFGRPSRDPDDAAIARYRYMLRTAPPEQVEAAHEEAFARLTPDQRRQVLEQLAGGTSPSEVHGDDPASLARTATRAEFRRPGTLERLFGGGMGGGYGGGLGMGQVIGGSLLGSVAGAFIGTEIAEALIPHDFDDSRAYDEARDSGYDSGYDQGYDSGYDQGYDSGDSSGGSDLGGGDDSGGGDFGGGDEV